MAELQKARRQGMPPSRTAMLEPPTIDPLAIHPASSGKRHHQPCRSFHERKLGDQTKDDIDKETSQRTVLWVFSNVVVQSEAPALDDRLYESHGVREAGWISLSGCLRNRVQLKFEQFGEDERLAFLGDARGQFAIGRAFSTGITMIQKDLVRAHFWLSLAAAQGNNEAARCRDKIVETIQNCKK